MTGLIRLNGVPSVRWSPLGFSPIVGRGASELDRALDAIASRVFADAPQAARAEKTTGPAGELRADVRENANAYIVRLDVPGVAKEDITVDVDEKTVRIEASFKHETVEGETAVLSERVNGSLSRAFRLPQAVDAEQASAHHEHGVLTLTLPKKNVSTQKRLTIN